MQKRPADFADFLRLMEEAGYAVRRGRGDAISFLVPGQEKPTRLRASTLGDGYDPEDIKAVIAGERSIPAAEDAAPASRRVGLIVDIEQRLREGKGPAYERWAKVYNLKQMAAALQFLRERQLTDYAALSAKTDGAVDRFHRISDELRATETELAHTSELMGAVVRTPGNPAVFTGGAFLRNRIVKWNHGKLMTNDMDEKTMILQALKRKDAGRFFFLLLHPALFCAILMVFTPQRKGSDPHSHHKRKLTHEEADPDRLREAVFGKGLQADHAGGNQ